MQVIVFVYVQCNVWSDFTCLWTGSACSGTGEEPQDEDASISQQALSLLQCNSKWLTSVVLSTCVYSSSFIQIHQDSITNSAHAHPLLKSAELICEARGRGSEWQCSAQLLTYAQLAKP